MTTLLAVHDLVKEYPGSRGRREQAVSGVSFTLDAGQTLGLVGESGCGKSTTDRCLLRLVEPTSGEVLLRGENLLALRRGPMRALRGDLQVVFQDPYGSLDPRMTVRAIVSETMRLRGVFGDEADLRVGELLERVGLRREHAHRYPTSSPAGSASASVSPEPSRRARRSWSSTNRSRHSTSASRRAC